MKVFDWKDKRVLVTGSTGFSGSWLTEDLVNKGAIVTSVVRKNSPRIDAIKHLKDKLKIVYGDLQDPEVSKKAIKDQEVVFDTAAITQVLWSVKRPAETIKNNFLCAANMLEALRTVNDKAILVYKSTDKVYGEPKYLPYDEEHPVGGKSPYDAAKTAADRTAFAYFQTYGLN